MRSRSRRTRPRDAVLGEEFGTDRARPAPLGHRPDRRHQELRPRRAGLGHPDRAAGRRRGRRSGVVSAPGAGRRWWAATRRPAPGPGAACRRRPPDPRLRGGAGWRTPRCPSPRWTAGGAGAAATASSSCPAGLAAPGPTATSGRTCWSPRARSTSPPSPTCSLWDMAALVPVVEEAGGRFTSLAGRTGPVGGSALATNGRLHDQVLGARRATTGRGPDPARARPALPQGRPAAQRPGRQAQGARGRTSRSRRPRRTAGCPGRSRPIGSARRPGPGAQRRCRPARGS